MMKSSNNGTDVAEEVQNEMRDLLLLHNSYELKQLSMFAFLLRDPGDGPRVYIYSAQSTSMHMTLQMLPLSPVAQVFSHQDMSSLLTLLLAPGIGS